MPKLTQDNMKVGQIVQVTADGAHSSTWHGFAVGTLVTYTGLITESGNYEFIDEDHPNKLDQRLSPDSFQVLPKKTIQMLQRAKARVTKKAAKENK